MRENTQEWKKRNAQFMSLFEFLFGIHAFSVRGSRRATTEGISLSKFQTTSFGITFHSDKRHKEMRRQHVETIQEGNPAVCIAVEDINVFVLGMSACARTTFAETYCRLHF